MVDLNDIKNNDARKFSGVFTALVTPFLENEDIDEEAFKQLIEFNIENGVSGIVPCGTTGECPTLTEAEQKRLIEICVRHADGRVFVIAGTGSNSTKKSIAMSKYAQEIGADALLIVNPYYNKPTQEGLYLHFKAIADAVTIPVVVYNIKGRTGVNLETKTLLRLIADCPNILAVKEASGDLMQIQEVIERVPPYFSVLSGDDNLTSKTLRMGACGVVSVASNLFPKEIVTMVNAGLSKNFDESDRISTELSQFFELLFIETNPIPIKYMLSLKNMCNAVYRLPLCELSEEHKQIVRAFIEQYDFDAQHNLEGVL